MLATLFMLSAMMLMVLAAFVALKTAPAPAIALALCVAPWTYPLETVQVGPLHVRFLYYLGVAALVLASGLDGLRRRVEVPPPLIILALFISFGVSSSLLNGVPAREWIPPVVRFLLYLGVLMSGMLLATDGGAPQSFPAVLKWFAIFSIPTVVLAFLQLGTGNTVTINAVERVPGPYLTRPLGLSLYLSALALTLLYLLISRAPLRVPRAWAAIYLALAGSALVVTHARIMAGALLVGALLLVLALPRPSSGSKWRTVSAPALAVLGAVVVGYLLVPGAKERVMAVTELDASMRLRLFIHAVGFEYIRESPLVGHGVGSFRIYFERLTGQSDVAAHDDMLAIAVETGALGLGLWFAFWLFALVYIWRAPLADDAEARAYRQLRALWLAISVAGLGIGGFENGLWYYESAAWTFLIGGYLCGWRLMDRRRARTPIAGTI